MTTHRPAIVVLVLCLLAGSGCGIPRDSEPRAVEVDVGRLGPTSSSSVPSGEAEVAVYFTVEAERLQRVTRKAESASDPALALRILLAGPSPEERQQKLTTSIPTGTELLDTTQEDDKLIVDLSRGIDGIQGDNLTTAFAQMVFTATAVKSEPPVLRVQFRVEGEDRTALSDDGSLPVVTKNNYSGANRPAP